MPNWKEIVGRSFSPEEFDSYCHGLVWSAWRPSFVVVHNTGSPSLAQRPNGLTQQHIANLVTYFRDERGWSAGPHLFVDDRQIWVFTPLTTPGVHSPSWNQQALGVEMLGDFDREDFTSGRGALVRDNTVKAITTLHVALGLDPLALKLHREDHQTTHACPGGNVKKLAFIQGVQDLIAQSHGNEHTIA